MINYTIKAYPTVYRGTTYRSRLEARWAAFFDQLGWEFIYEPFDLGDWSPDFLLKGTGVGTDILVEVKPINDFCPETGAKIEKAMAGQRELAWSALLVGISPIKPKPPLLYARDPGYLQLGWQCLPHQDYEPLATPQYQEKLIWYKAPLAWLPNRTAPIMVADVLMECVGYPMEWVGWRTLQCGKFSNESSDEMSFGYPEHGNNLWGNASKIVQYRPGRRS